MLLKHFMIIIIPSYKMKQDEYKVKTYIDTISRCVVRWYTVVLCTWVFNVTVQRDRDAWDGWEHSTFLPLMINPKRVVVLEQRLVETAHAPVITIHSMPNLIERIQTLATDVLIIDISPIPNRDAQKSMF